MKKRILTLTLVSAMCLSMAACGGKSTGGSKASSNSSKLTYSSIKLGEDKDLKASITMFNNRTDMGSDKYGGKNWKAIPLYTNYAAGWTMGA